MKCRLFVSGVAVAVAAAALAVQETRPPDADGAVWIAPEGADGADCPRLRKIFDLPTGEIASARVRVCGLGLYELWVNGARADETRVLSPGWSNPNRQVLFDCYDVAPALKPGARNAVGVHLAPGYGPDFNKWGWRWFGGMRAIAVLDVLYRDGRRVSVPTDGTWESTRSQPVLYASIYGGEVFDASRADPAWCTPDRSVARWSGVAVLSGDSPTLRPNVGPAIRRFAPLKPVRTIPVPSGAQVLDFGQNRAGVVAFRVKAPRGTVVRVTCAEEMTEDGRGLDLWTSRAARQQDIYLCAGTGDWETWMPRFTYHGFRYVEVSGLAKEAVADGDFTSWAISADVPPAGSFTSSDATLNWLSQAAQWSMRSNMMSYPTDCCMRDERTPCLMDSQCYEDAAVQYFGMRDFYLKWLDDVLNYTIKYDGHNRNPDWEGDGIALAHRLWLYCGCRDETKSRWPELRRLADHFAARLDAEGGLWLDGGFGDWCPPRVRDGDGSFKREVVEVNTALAAAQFGWMSEMAEDFGFAADAQRYAERKEKASGRFREAFLGPEALARLEPRQTTLAMALALDLVPEDVRPSVSGALVRRIREKDNGRIDTGIYGTRYLGDALIGCGAGELWLSMLKGPGEPSFGYMMSRGATTLWEQWAYWGWMHSHNHAMMSGAATPLFTRLAGIRPLKPGYAEVLVDPADVKGIDSFCVVRETPCGRISVKMTRGADGKAVFNVEHDDTMHVVRRKGSK